MYMAHFVFISLFYYLIIEMIGTHKPIVLIETEEHRCLKMLLHLRQHKLKCEITLLISVLHSILWYDEKQEPIRPLFQILQIINLLYIY